MEAGCVLFVTSNRHAWWLVKLILDMIDLGNILNSHRGRVVSELFEDLVSRRDYPEYYEVITRPIALATIQQKLESNSYSSIDQFADDLNLMVENAKSFNIKGSKVYKDATILQEAFQVELENEMGKTRSAQPTEGAKAEARGSGKENLYDNMRKVLDTIAQRSAEDGRLLVEMFEELPDKESYPDYYQEIKNPIALNVIRQRVDDHTYKSLAEFESDFALMVANAMEYNAEGSDIYEDATALQDVFNELTKGTSAPAPRGGDNANLQSLTYKGFTYNIGDFVYIFNPNDPHKPTVAQILAVWKKKSPNGGEKEGVTTCWYLRPEQTSHRPSARFLKNEVFKTTHNGKYFANEIVGRCWVLHYKDYIKGRPPGANENDVFVCESRYNEQQKQMSKIRNWASCIPPNAVNKTVDLVLFPTPIIPSRIFTAFPSQAADAAAGAAAAQSVAPNTQAAFIAPTSQVPQGAPQSAAFQSLTPQLPRHLAPSVHGTPQGMVTAQSAITPMVCSSGPSASLFAAYAAATPYTSTASHQHMQTTAPIPAPIGYESLPMVTVETFETTDDGKIKWFAAPPLDVIDDWTAVHSLDYLYKKALDKRKRSSVEQVVTAGSGKRLKKLQIEKQRASMAELHNGTGSNVAFNTNGPRSGASSPRQSSLHVFGSSAALVSEQTGSSGDPHGTSSLVGGEEALVSVLGAFADRWMQTALGS
ncbi:uncharacterized protein EV422DRAFT_547313 [Fimicolochytrium jonesii]|uniref:uncharacterized protein n=1 Tax=Fimicolochytrium jonesii TaxID=1396493 RepID=UPI0022FE18CE|nr:uncharacterized protein EV422DRAFT_547313 [Fimicolochytrium jonesii]KAI8816100.1 hypothetical protein EV422DRAFT_547313 [Fimicolochytrium jonesii]